MFRLLNTSATGTIDLAEFYRIYDVLALKWTIRNDQPYWFSNLQPPLIASLANQIHRLVTWVVFEYFICKNVFASQISHTD